MKSIQPPRTHRPLAYRLAAIALLALLPCATQAGRTLPANWGWHQVWPRDSLFADGAQLLKTDAALYRLSGSSVARSTDGYSWESITAAEVPGEASAAIPNQPLVYFPLSGGSVDLSSPMDDPGGLAGGTYTDAQIFSRGDHLLGFVGPGAAESDTTIVSTDGGSTWQTKDLGWNASPPFYQVLEAGGVLHLFHQIALVQPGSRLAWVDHYTLDSTDQVVWVERVTLPFNSTFLVWKDAFYCEHGGVVLPLDEGDAWQDNQCPRQINLFADGTVAFLQSAKPHSVALIEDPLDSASLPTYRDVPTQELLLEMEISGEVIVVVDWQGSVFTSTDRGLNWQKTADQCWGGQLTVGPAGFVYTAPESFATSDDGFSWAWTSPSLPAPEAHLVGDSAGHLAWAPGTTNATERLWRLNRDGNWELLTDHAAKGFRPTLAVQSAEYAYHGSYLSDMDLFIAPDSTRGVLMRSFQNEWSPQIGSFLPLAHGNGFFVAGRGFVYNDFFQRLDGDFATNTPPFTRAVFNGSRFLGLESFASVGGDGSRTWESIEPSLYLSDPVPEFPFSEGIVDVDGWRFSEWFRWINTEHYPWVFNYPLGWVWVNGPRARNCWLWDTHEGWYWTSELYFPQIWSEDQGWRVHPVYAAKLAKP